MLRNPDEHKSSTQQDREKLSVEFGINHRSILDQLQHFKVSSGALVQDVMHDVLEGNPTHICLFIIYLCFDRYS